MAAFPARDERRFDEGRREEALAPGERSPQLQRAQQVANAARARAVRIRAEFGEVQRPPARPPTPPRIVPAPPRAPSFPRAAPPARPAIARLEPDTPAECEPPDVEPAAPIQPATVEPSTKGAEVSAPAPVESADAAPPEPAATVPEVPAEPAKVEAAPPPADASDRAEAPATPAAKAPEQPRFARTRAAIQTNRLSGWAIELNEDAPDEPKKAWPRLGGALKAGAAAPAQPAPEAASARVLPDGLGRITPGRSRRQAPRRQEPGANAPGAPRRGPQPGASAPAPSREASAPPATAPRKGLGAAYRSVRNSIGVLLGVVVGAVLLVGLRGDGTLDVVGSVWSMKPPRAVTVERMLTLDLPPFEEVVEVTPRPQLKVVDAAGAGAAEVTTASAPGGGDGGAGLDFLDGVAADDPRVADLAAVARREPSRWDVFYDLGHVMQSRGDLAAAERLYRRAIGLNPRHAALAYDLGYVLQRRGDFEAAREQYRAALALKPDHAYALYNLGALLRREGAYAEAAEHLERAGRLQGDNPDLYYEWARTLEARGQPDQAIDLYKQAAALSPDRWPGPEARARMQTLLSEGPQAAGPRS